MLFLYSEKKIIEKHYLKNTCTGGKKLKRSHYKVTPERLESHSRRIMTVTSVVITPGATDRSISSTTKSLSQTCDLATV